jgi:acyl-CoA reductase-like NAD-dependent aldehyde dehydrogenase
MVLAEVPPDAKVACMEAFGPVVGINGFQTLEEAIDRVNDSPYGLQAGIYTRDIQKAFRAARHSCRRLQSQGAAIPLRPHPYGGVKMSGIGREGRVRHRGDDQPKLICWKC